jgi:hypothetical protein
MTHIDTLRLDESRRPENPGSRVEPPHREPSRPSADDRSSAAVHRRQLTPVIALLVAVVAAVLAVIAFADDDVASTPAPVPTTASDVVAPPNAQPAGVPDGVPCPNPPARGIVPC